MGWIVIGVMAAAVALVTALAISRIVTSARSGHHRPSGLFSTDDEHLTVRSADNVRLLSDSQLRELERPADE